MTYSYSTDRLVKVEGAWVRVSAVQAVVRTPSGHVGIHLACGNRVDVGWANGSVTPDDVIDRLFGSADQ